MPEIRHITEDEMLSHFAPLHEYALGITPPVNVSRYEDFIERKLYSNTINLGMFDEDKLLASVITTPMTENVRGKIFKMGGIFGVTSDPRNRRQGYVRDLMVATHKQLFEEGYAVATLYPFRESFYERLGYTAFVHHRRWKFKTSDLKPILNLELPGSVDYVLLQDGWDIFEKAITDYQAQCHGMGLFIPEQLKELYGKADRWLAIARDESGEVVGVMPYKITRFWGTFDIQTLFTKNSLGRYLLLQWIARHIDQVNDVDIHRLSPTEHPETWFNDMKLVGDPDIWLSGMGRVINVRKLDGMQVGAGRFTVEIEDEHCEWNNGIFTFEGYDGLLHVSEATEADCKLTAQGLSGLIYGTHDPNDFQWRGWGNPSPETITAMQSVFPKMQPYLFVVF